MSRTRWGFVVPVDSAKVSEANTLLRLDFGNSCFGSFTIPAKVIIGRTVTVYLEIEDGSLNETNRAEDSQVALDGGLGNG